MVKLAMPRFQMPWRKPKPEIPVIAYIDKDDVLVQIGARPEDAVIINDPEMGNWSRVDAALRPDTKPERKAVTEGIAKTKARKKETPPKPKSRRAAIEVEDDTDDDGPQADAEQADGEDEDEDRPPERGITQYGETKDRGDKVMELLTDLSNDREFGHLSRISHSNIIAVTCLQTLPEFLNQHRILPLATIWYKHYLRNTVGLGGEGRHEVLDWKVSEDQKLREVSERENWGLPRP